MNPKAVRSLLLLALVGLACSIDFGQLRESTYPPQFNYIPEDRLQQTMWQLGSQSQELDRLMRESDPSDEMLQEQVLRLLGEMAETSRALGPADWPSNHPRVSRNVGAFRDEIAAARRDAARRPPSYFRAGSVTGACLLCHGHGAS